MVPTMFIYVCLGVFLSTVSSGQGSACSPGWTINNGSCYHISHDEEDWRGALYICKMIGGYLVEVGSMEEQKYLITATGNQSYWIGLTDLVEEGIWQWMSSKTMLGYRDYTDWAPKQPDNRYNYENCVAFNKQTDNHWMDEPCVARHYYVCESTPTSARY